jgi:hypothetical protein
MALPSRPGIRAHDAVGIDQHQLFDPAGGAQRQAKRDRASHRKANQADLLQAQHVQQVLYNRDIEISRVLDSRPVTQSIAWQIGGEDAVMY